MTPSATIIVSDAHLGFSSDRVREAFHRFLTAVPDLGDHLVLNGDVFDFWFEYRSVIPRSAFATLTALDTVRRAGVRVTVTGGNHDRWGGAFWRNELGASFHRGAVELELAGRRALVAHGDELFEPHRGARIMRAVTRNAVTETVFRWIHPDVGLALVRGMSRLLAGSTRDEAFLRRAAEAQAQFARQLLERRTDLELVVLGHTHRPVLEEIAEGRWYLNPGAWMDGSRYAVIGVQGPALCVFEEGRR